MKKRIRLAELFPGSTRVAVYRPGAALPHFFIVGVSALELDQVKVADYMYECDWTDRGAKGWITPELRCDEFLVRNS